MTSINQRVAELLSAAMCAEDAEAQGMDARELVADPDRAVRLLGPPGPPQTARYAVVQRFGGVGALLVIACEQSYDRLHGSPVASDVAQTCPDDSLRDHLGHLLRDFSDLSPVEMDGLVERVEKVEAGSRPTESTAARRWLHVTYAVAARDGTDEAHRAYVQALDGVLDETRALVAI
jgi:hypothetical protein